ncbi:MAG: methionyl-tRNA formyltransferase [Blastocatellia bacterium]|nr:methionyl-tRNA formyltransferase [Blastocatellia bacterium]
MRTIFLGTPEMAVPSFERVVADGHQVVAVFTQPDKPSGRGKQFHPTPVKVAAQKYHLPVYQPSKIRTEEMRQLFTSLAPEVAVIVAYGRIIPDWMLSIPKFGFVNVHFSLLPAYRGAAPVNWAVVNGEKKTGVTTMQVVPELDAGDILQQASVDIEVEETAVELGHRLSLLGADLLSETLKRLPELKPEKQGEGVSYAPILKREDGVIDWQNSTAEEIVRRIRGFQPWPGSYTTLNGTRLLLWQAQQVQLDREVKHQPGEIVQLDKDAIVVASKDSYLAIRELQLEGRKRLSARDFLNGIRLQIGQILGETS